MTTKTILGNGLEESFLDSVRFAGGGRSLEESFLDSVLFAGGVELKSPPLIDH